MVETYVKEWELDALDHGAAIEVNETWDCNWKIAITNSMESYHLFKVHPSSLEPITPSRSAYYIAGSARATVTGGTVKGGSDYLLVSIPPGFVGVFTEESIVWLAVHPVDTHRCTQRVSSSYIAKRDSSVSRP